MTEITPGSGPYVYVCTRMRVRKAKLLPREEYLRMLNMSLPEITRFIEETEYKQEIDELSSSFSGIDLLEVALSWNLAKEYQKILDITPGTLRYFTESYLRRWDIQNVLTIMRGKAYGISTGQIKEILIPAGRLDRIFLDRLLSEDGPERIAEALKGQKPYPVIERELPAALETGSYARMENELYKQFYKDLIDDARSGIKGGKLFLEYVRLEIDIRNIQNLFRLRFGGLSEDIRDLMIPGGSFGLDEMQRLSQYDNDEEFVEGLKKHIRIEEMQDLLDDLKSGSSIHRIEIDLTRIMLNRMESLSKRYPFSIYPILVYLEKKKYEVNNLRAMARGKESHLQPEQIQGYLVM